MRATKSDLGKACELYVLGDLLARGLKVTYPYNVNGRHDVHARIGRKWYTIQCESGQLRKSGKLASRKVKRTVFSDILALVHIPTGQLHYIANKTTVPEILNIDLLVLYAEDPCPFLNSNNAPAATPTPNASSRRTSSKPARSAGKP